MPNDKRHWLVESVRATFLPALVELGFSLVEPKSGVARETKAAFPFGRHRRPRGSGLDVAEVQLDNGPSEPGFSVSFGHVPREGARDIWGEPIAPEEVLSTWLDTSFTLYEKPRSFKPFAVRRWFWQAPASRLDYENLALGATRYLPEIDDALTGRGIGPHVRVLERTLQRLR